jgi:hypothetical protein
VVMVVRSVVAALNPATIRHSAVAALGLNGTVPLPCASGRKRAKAAGPWRRSWKTRSRYSPERLFYSREDPATTAEGRPHSLSTGYLPAGERKCRVAITDIPQGRTPRLATAGARVLSQKGAWKR